MSGCAIWSCYAGPPLTDTEGRAWGRAVDVAPDEPVFKPREQVQDEGAVERITVRALAPASGPAPQFMRLRLRRY